MKKSKIAFYAVIICVICAVCVVISTMIANHAKKAGDKKSIPSSGDADYLDDLDAPAIAEMEEKHPYKVRRGYIPINLGRQED